MFWKRHQGVPLSRIELLRRVPMFADLPDDLLAKVDTLVSEMFVDAGTTLMVEDEPGREAFIIAEGTADVLVRGSVVATAGPGALVGEMSLLDNQPRSATVVASTGLRILVMDPGQFATVISDPHAAQWVAASLSKRLRAARNVATL
jgi:CRP/FNR family cyclic AMP-dependent transcriptional regulator